ncbi:alanyl-tRNA synthetase [Abditibacterium utsteinense]|uniref:Alanine--tRNA ligase n=1 Tax=Abditibacterium utsteinense TaxID=1960156 RepID=A0A2S8SXA9_9BACT|nr:alanine--tRNA ligase [Abditibacterium utsteinense]PQV65440.1 alanyl-tRNA synthetase [Abditibacterium utsteinense]
MTGNELRAQYLQFWESKNSLILPSSSLIPTDPTTLLTSAGMQPLVPFFKGEETPPSSRLTSCQKCCRADDIEQVGVTWRHASFFEMLGNFSFGDYFKREAIVWGWEFLTKTLGIDPNVLYVSVYFEDLEAPEIWKKDVGLSDDRIFRFDKKDNWWGPVGKSGPCGPDSEIFYDRGAKYDTGDAEMDRPGGDGDRYGEIWNLVFQQYNQTESGQLLALPAPGIDTGMGLERTAAILQNVDTIHHTDLFAPIINAISATKNQGEIAFDLSTPQLHPEDPTTKPLKVVADHARAAIFLASDGVTPGNNGRDYMLRRFIRRAYLNGRTLGLDKPFLHRLVPIVEQGYGAIYPELIERGDLISDLILREEERFGVTIESGMNRLDDLMADAKSKGKTQLSGAEVFSLYSSQGFPPELTADILSDNNLSFDQNEFQAASESHSKVSGNAVGEYQKREFDGLQTQFLGYETTKSDAKIVAIRDGKIALDKSPFYAESGGQSGDSGEIIGENGRAQILDTKKEGKTWVHFAEIQGELKEGDAVTAVVDAPRRRAIERAHSATHLLHAALRGHLGKHVEQRGSLVEGDRLRFDFVHFSAISSEELQKIEATVNEEILASLPVEIAEKTLAEARAMGAMALFGEKYGDVVRTVKMGDFSLELCGGTHLSTTSAAGLLRIVSEGGVGANVRRIEALTGEAAFEHDRAQNEKLREVAASLGARPENALAAAQKLVQKTRELEKQLAEMQRKLSGGAADEILSQATEIKGIAFVASRAPENLSADALRELADQISQKMNGVAVLASENGGKVSWAVKATKAAVEKGAHAGNIVKQLAQITGGNGGGRPDFAFAGGKDVSKIDEALNQASSLV